MFKQSTRGRGGKIPGQRPKKGLCPGFQCLPANRPQLDMSLRQSMLVIRMHYRQGRADRSSRLNPCDLAPVHFAITVYQRSKTQQYTLLAIAMTLIIY